MFLWCIGRVGHPQPPPVELGTGVLWVSTGTHPCRVVKEPKRQPYTHWTTCYDFDEMRNIELCSYTSSQFLKNAFLFIFHLLSVFACFFFHLLFGGSVHSGRSKVTRVTVPKFSSL